jgi:hypothetical protein
LALFLKRVTCQFWNAYCNTACSGFCIKKHADFPPASTSEGEQLRFPPSDARLAPLTALCLPFSGRTLTPALRPRGHTPLESPLICVHKKGHKSIKVCSVYGSALLSNGEEPCPLRLQTVFSTQKPSQNRNTDFAGAKVACFRCTQPDL